MRPRTIAPVIAVALAFGATAAAAVPADQISVRVQVADLNLQSPAGASVALRRIRNAARAICGGEVGGRDLARQAMSDACVRKSVDATVVAAHSPTLARLNGTPLLETAVAAAD